MWIVNGDEDVGDGGQKRYTETGSGEQGTEGWGNVESGDEGNVRQGRTGLERKNIKETCKRKSERGGWWKELCARNMRNHELMGGNHRWIIE